MNRTLGWVAPGLFLVGLLVYSQTLAFHWDEGFHLLAARAIAAGQRPYVDFCFPQAPLNAYWTSAWFRLFHPSWRLAQGLAACETSLAVVLLAGYLRKRFPIPEWRAAAAISAVSFFGLLLLTFDYGTIAQAYGFCLAALLAAFRCTVAARERESSTIAFAAGLLAGIACCASLLCVTAAPVLLVWLWLYSQPGARLRPAAAFAAGCAVAAIPVLRALAEAPREAWFNLAQYHLFYRQTGWSGVAEHDFGIATRWLLDTDAILLAGFAVAGCLAARRGVWAVKARAEFRLCLWLAAGIAIQNVCSHPTFPQYFLLALPFLAVLAAAGFCAVVSHLPAGNRPSRAAGALACFLGLVLVRGMYGERGGHSWTGLEPVAEKVDRVTPSNAEILAPEAIYFLSGRSAPPGLEFQASYEINLGVQANARFHILPLSELDRDIRAGRFATAAVCADDDQTTRIAGANVYTEKFESGDCTVFWKIRADRAQAVPERGR